jgi:hypothetical protein
MRATATSTELELSWLGAQRVIDLAHPASYPHALLCTVRVHILYRINMYSLTYNLSGTGAYAAYQVCYRTRFILHCEGPALTPPTRFSQMHCVAVLS